MKKLLALFLAFMLLFCCALSEETAEEEPLVAGEGEILLHGYISPYKDYYIGVPAEWAIMGAGSTNENLSSASEMLEDLNVYDFVRRLNAENDALVCLSEDGASGLILVYGPCEGVTNDAMVKALPEIQAAIKGAFSGVTFKDNCGAYEFKSLAEILNINMTYKGRDFIMYYVVNGTDMYIFTFFGTDSQIAQTILTTFVLK